MTYPLKLIIIFFWVLTMSECSKGSISGADDQFFLDLAELMLNWRGQHGSSRGSESVVSGSELQTLCDTMGLGASCITNISRELLEIVLWKRRSSSQSKDMFYALDKYTNLTLFPVVQTNGVKHLMSFYERQLVECDMRILQSQLASLGLSVFLPGKGEFASFMEYARAAALKIKDYYLRNVTHSAFHFCLPQTLPHLMYHISVIESKYGFITSSPRELRLVQLYLLYSKYHFCYMDDLEAIETLSDLTLQIMSPTNTMMPYQI